MKVFGLLEAKTAGKPIPGDVAYDDKGNSTTDPAEALKGAIRVFDRCVPRLALLPFLFALCRYHVLVFAKNTIHGRRYCDGTYPWSHFPSPSRLSTTLSLHHVSRPPYCWNTEMERGQNSMEGGGACGGALISLSCGREGHAVFVDVGAD